MSWIVAAIVALIVGLRTRALDKRQLRLELHVVQRHEARSRTDRGFEIAARPAIDRRLVLEPDEDVVRRLVPAGAGVALDVDEQHQLGAVLRLARDDRGHVVELGLAEGFAGDIDGARAGDLHLARSLAAIRRRRTSGRMPGTRGLGRRRGENGASHVRQRASDDRHASRPCDKIQEPLPHRFETGHRGPIAPAAGQSVSPMRFRCISKIRCGAWPGTTRSPTCLSVPSLIVATYLMVAAGPAGICHA